MRAIGFSTGALAKGDFRSALAMLAAPHASPTAAIELSALRSAELTPLVDAVCDGLDLSAFKYVSLHAPSNFEPQEERSIVDNLIRAAKRIQHIVVHPDAMVTVDLWRGLGNALCIENMDKRKPRGRTTAELDQIFEKFPAANLCFDIGHARQNDPTMHIAADILNRFTDRLRQVHISDVNSSSRHERLNGRAIAAFQKVSQLIPEGVPAILESPVIAQDIENEIALARQALLWPTNLASRGDYPLARHSRAFAV